MNSKFTQILSLLVGLMVLSASALYAQPANNECSGAIDISSLFDGETNTSTLFDNTGATSEASDPDLAVGASCFDDQLIQNSVWFSFVGDGNTYQVSTIQCSATNYIAGGDSQMALHAGDCGTTTLTGVPNGCSEDGPGAVPGNFFAQITFETVAGTTYYLMIDGWQAASGEFCLEVVPSEITCDAGSLTTVGDIAVMGETETFDLAVENLTIPDVGEHWWLFLPGAGAGGGPASGGAWAIPTNATMETFTSTLNGVVLAMTGTWQIRSYVTATDAINDECNRSDNFLTVTFDETMIVTDCEAGTMLTTGTVVVMGEVETFTVEAEGILVPNSPTQGELAWYFNNANTGGTGGLGTDFWLPVGSGNEVSYNSDLNGILSGANPPFPLLAGTWEITTRVWNDAETTTTVDPCDTGEGMLTVTFDLPDPQPECEAGTMITAGEINVGPTEAFDLEVGDFLVPNTPETGRLWWLFVPGDNATGGFDNGGTWGIPTAGIDTYTSSINGNPAMTGTWQIFSYVTSTNNINDQCSISENFLTVNFEILDPGPCDAGVLSSTAIQMVCVGDQGEVSLVAGTDTVPQGGFRGWLFDPTFTGGSGTNIEAIFQASSTQSFDNTLNGALATPLEGGYAVKSFMYTIPSNPGGSICSISSDSVLVVFGDIVDLEIIENNGDLSAFVGANFMDYTYAWSTGETEITITVTEPGEYSVTATDGIGCETVSTINFMPVSTNEADIVNSLTVAPNPTSGLINVALDLPAAKEVQLSVIDITGKEVLNLAPANLTSSNFEVNLQDQANGLYLLRFRIGNDVVTRRVVKN